MKSINSSLNIKTSHHDTLNYCYTQNNIRCYTQHKRLRSEFYSMKHKSKQSNVNLINTDPVQNEENVVMPESNYSPGTNMAQYENVNCFI